MELRVVAPNTNSYVAMGFSPNGSMVGSSAVVGWLAGESSATMKRYFLGGKTPSQVLVDQGNLQILQNSSLIISFSSRMYLAFQLVTDQPGRQLVFAVGSSNNQAPSSPSYRLTIPRSVITVGFNYDSGIAYNGAAQKVNMKRKLVTRFSCSIAGIMFVCFVIHFWRKRLCRKTSNQQIEMFTRDYGTLAPKRYKYSEIKKMTNSFKEELGRGGYGIVYKGLSPDGQLIAVKLFVGALGDGEDFINEVVGISRTCHVNIVTLFGFCIEGKKRALIYEFMPNGSLDKFLRGDDSRLDWNTLFQIAKGIARGLEYLHRGCSTRMVHFDIKPHNILLDEEFVPKISDFGLAKLCKKKESIVSVMGARGTAGYMAPEVFLKSLGGASHKSDVYSYGMMVLEMTGSCENNNACTTSKSEAYFPEWIYKKVEAGDNLGVNGVSNEDEDELARKMVTVSLWCIQSSPSDRPSISKVVEMLEGSLESLQVPPSRFWPSPTRPAQASSSLVTQSSTGN